MVKDHKKLKKIKWNYGIMDGYIPFIIANEIIDFDELPEACSAYYAKEGFDVEPYIQLCSEYNEEFKLTVVMFLHAYGYCKKELKEYHRYSVTPVQKKYKKALKWLAEDFIRNYKRNLFKFPLKSFPIIKTSSKIDVDMTASVPSICGDMEYIIRVESIEGKIEGNPTMEMVHISITLKPIYGGKSEDVLLWNAIIYCDINTAKLNMIYASMSYKETKWYTDLSIDTIINDILEDFDVYVENGEAVRNEVCYIAAQFETVKRIIPVHKIGGE